jgi:ABC-2 type transport system permease protein
VTFSEESIDKAVDDLYADKSDMILHIPQNFERDLHNYKTADLQVLINAINNTSASLMNAYTNSIVMDYNKDIMIEISNRKLPETASFNIESSF